MAKYQVETEGGKYLVETDDSGPEQPNWQNAKKIGAGIVESGEQLGQGIVNTVLHPIQTANAIINPIKRVAVTNPIAQLAGISRDLGTASVTGKFESQPPQPVLGINPVNLANPRDVIGTTAQAVSPLAGPVLGTGLYMGGGALAEGKPLTGPVEHPSESVVGSTLKGLGTGLLLKGVGNVAEGTKDLAGNVIEKGRKTFIPNIEEAAVKAKVPQSAIDTIKKVGVDSLDQIKTSGENADTIAQRIVEGQASKQDLADASYNQAVNGYNRKYVDTPTFQENLQKETAQASDIAQTNPVVKKLQELYQSIVKSPDRKLRGSTWQLTKQEMLDTRDALNAMFREDTTGRIVMKLKNSLFDDAEGSGMKGLNEARQMEAQSKDMASLIKKYSDIKKLNNYHNWTPTEKAEFQSVVDHIGDKSIDSDLNNISASQYLDKIRETQTKANTAGKKILKGAGLVAAGYLSGRKHLPF
jgi:hypothetical protein